MAFSVPMIEVMPTKYYKNNVSQSKSQKYFSIVLAWELKFENQLRLFSKTNKTTGLFYKPHKDFFFFWKAVITMYNALTSLRIYCSDIRIWSFFDVNSTLYVPTVMTFNLQINFYLNFLVDGEKIHSPNPFQDLCAHYTSDVCECSFILMITII